jgi:hypothetical protein
MRNLTLLLLIKIFKLLRMIITLIFLVLKSKMIKNNSNFLCYAGFLNYIQTLQGQIHDNFSSGTSTKNMLFNVVKIKSKGFELSKRTYLGHDKSRLRLSVFFIHVSMSCSLLHTLLVTRWCLFLVFSSTISIFHFLLYAQPRRTCGYFQHPYPSVGFFI